MPNVKILLFFNLGFPNLPLNINTNYPALTDIPYFCFNTRNTLRTENYLIEVNVMDGFYLSTHQNKCIKHQTLLKKNLMKYPNLFTLVTDVQQIHFPIDYKYSYK